MGLNAAVQALEKAEQLKGKVVNTSDILNDKEAWACQQQLKYLYQQVLTLDLEYALDRKVEQDLWNLCFKNTITTLQVLAKDKKNTKRGEYQAMLMCHLEEASGFYLTLLQTMCMAFNLDLPFLRKGSLFGGGSKSWEISDYVIRPHRSSSTYICQHCLVHLGDLARYGNRNKQAEGFYRHAVRVSPNSGQPYNQLALLETNRGDTLSTVFHYVRSVAVKNPFSAAITNLSLTFAKCVEERSYIETRTKLSASEYIATFLRLHGLFHSGTELDLAEKLVGLLATTLTAHVATESLPSWKLIQMLVINLFAYHNTQQNTEERRIKKLTLNLIASSLSTFLLPVYTLKEGDNLLDYFALPAIKLTLDWICYHPTVLYDAAFTSRLQIWPSLCKMLNELQALLDLTTLDEYSNMPLPEDRELQGFTPLEKSLNNLRFSWNNWEMKADTISKVRAHRLLEFGNWLTTREGIIVKKVSAEGTATFEAVGGQQIPPSELIRELEELSLNKLPSPVPSETGSSATGTSSPTTSLEPQPEFGLERRIGILKVQSSLEGKESSEWVSPPVQIKSRQQNVAIQAIIRRGKEDNTKQKVTFKTPSPSPSPHSSQSTDDNKSNSTPFVWPQPSSFVSQTQHISPPPTNTPSTLPFLPDFSVPPPNFPITRFPPPQLPSIPTNDFASRNVGQNFLSNYSASNVWAREDTSRQWLGPRAASLSETLRQPLPSTNILSAFSIPPPQPLLMEEKNWNQKQHSPTHNSPAMMGTPPLFSNTAAANTYSLFSTPSWTNHPPSSASSYKLGNVTGVTNSIGQQSLWSGPGPSPLERLLEQQKQLREGPAPKGGT